MSKQEYSVEFQNPYWMKMNWLTYIYSLQYRYTGNNRLVRYFLNILALMIRFIGFLMLKLDMKIFTKAKMKDKKFEARATNSQFRSIYTPEYSKCYEPDVYGAISIFVPKNGLFVDVGSNWGHHSFIAAINKGAEVYAFEPNPVVFQDIQSISQELNMEELIKPFQCALGAEDSMLALEQSRFESGIASISSEYIEDRSNSYHWLDKALHSFFKPLKYTVQIKKLDEVLRDVSGVDLIKIDAEGAEMGVLKGATETIKRFNPKVIFEVHTDQNANLDEFEKFFSSLEYKLYTVHHDVDQGNLSLISLQNLKPLTLYNIVAAKELTLHSE